MPVSQTFHALELVLAMEMCFYDRDPRKSVEVVSFNTKQADRLRVVSKSQRDKK